MEHEALTAILRLGTLDARAFLAGVLEGHVGVATGTHRACQALVAVVGGRATLAAAAVAPIGGDTDGRLLAHVGDAAEARLALGAGAAAGTLGNRAQRAVIGIGVDADLADAVQALVAIAAGGA